ncbi:uncharacterized protein I303_105307 [Kwoniella dejecticola CBS 10117]|uniref:Mid2 domain-containing protein n=1 Tax=Kwoniella dejecticola CBS 10117 TaxID=1296121 RepID=A0A1A6A2W0_9TREE|nr:uncharacterized protein I303_05246 [Kwoniella dejecticola CBS 10117]OBR84388.1 hypothetical protein I303_05246 [Kwoniella dejecticola CBS 10117]
MHITSAALPLLLLPLTLARQGTPAHPARRHHARAIIDANRPVPRAGGVIDNGTLASISQHDAQISATQSAVVSSTATATQDDSDSAITSAVTSASNSGKYGDGLPSTSSSIASSTILSSSSSDLATSSVTSETSEYQSFLSATLHQSSFIQDRTSATANVQDYVSRTSLNASEDQSTTLSSFAIISTSVESSYALSSSEETGLTDIEYYFSTSTGTSTSSIAPSTTVVSTDAGPSTIAPVETSAVASTTAHSTVVLVTTASRSQTTHRASSTAESAESEKKSSGLSKTALIAIIVVASVVGAAGIGWTLFRKWKLRPSNRFDRKLNPIDFSPNNGDMNDDFFEKTLQRTASNSSASRQRRELVAELDDPSNVAGVPQHDFTAGTAGVGAGYAMYNQDPYAHAEQYDYEAAYQHQHQQAHQGYDQHQYPPQAMTQDHQGYAGYQGAPTQDDGYADLQRGNSIGSGSGHGHQQQYQHGQDHQQVYPGELQFPSADQYGLGRPTGGAEGPYAQAATYRGY